MLFIWPIVCTCSSVSCILYAMSVIKWFSLLVWILLHPNNHDRFHWYSLSVCNDCLSLVYSQACACSRSLPVVCRHCTNTKQWYVTVYTASFCVSSRLLVIDAWHAPPPAWNKATEDWWPDRHPKLANLSQVSERLGIIKKFQEYHSYSSLVLAS